MKRKFYTTWRVVVGCQIRRNRELAQMTQGEMAERMGLSQGTWSRIERGRAPIHAHRLAELAEVVGIRGCGVRAPSPTLLHQLREHGVDVRTRPDPERQELGHQAVYSLLYP